jgi:hypothetical protein
MKTRTAINIVGNAAVFLAILILPAYLNLSALLTLIIWGIAFALAKESGWPYAPHRGRCGDD